MNAGSKDLGRPPKVLVPIYPMIALTGDSRSLPDSFLVAPMQGISARPKETSKNGKDWY